MRLLYLLILLLPFISFSQDQDYNYKNIDGILLKNADAVVRLDEMHLNILDYKSMEIKSKRIVTVLNENGEKHINAYAFYDDNSKIKNISALILDSEGKEIKKIKERDFIDKSASGDGTLYSDSRVKFMRYTPVDYPYTVIFEKIYTTADTAFIPNWSFLDGYRVSTENSSFIFNLNAEIEFRKKESNFLPQYNIETIEKGSFINYRAKNLMAIESESYSPSFYDFAPNVKFALNKFHLKGVDGSAENWDEFGKWINHSLLKGHDELDPSTVTKIKNLVQGIENPKKKVEKVYQYVQNNTRYISVQLGIGGWMPISAKEVDKVKYGDCKGLTNYTMALLKAIGIESFYTVVHAGSSQRSLDSDFPSLQGNHVFLNVPLQNEELWLECTSQVVPVNYLGTFTDNRYVLKVTPEGGSLVKSRVYKDEENKQITNASIHISEMGKIIADVKIASSGTQYNQKYRLPLQDKQDNEEHYKEYWDYINALELGSINFKNDKSKIELVEEIKLTTSNYLSKAGDNILFAPNMFNRNSFVPKKNRNRKRNLVIKRGYLDEDEFTITLPKNYKVESLIAPVKISNEFGEYTMSIEKVEENQLLYKRSLLIKSGEHASEKYESFRNFRKKIARTDNSKIILKNI